jgi:hypothetical protein
LLAEPQIPAKDSPTNAVATARASNHGGNDVLYSPQHGNRRCWLALAQFASPAQAAYVVTLLEVPAGGGITNLVATGSGSIDLTDLSRSFSDSGTGFLAPNQGNNELFLTGIGAYQAYTGATGPTSFGTGNGGTTANSNSGDFVGVGCGNTIEVPSSYISGHALSDTSTYDNATFASLHIIPGTYTWTWGTGAHADSFTAQIGPVATTPEPASLTLLAMGLAGLGMVLRTRRA